MPRPEALRDGVLRCFFSTASGWGIAAVEDGRASVRLLGGTLDLAEATIEHPELGGFRLSAATRVTAGETVELTST